MTNKLRPPRVSACVLLLLFGIAVSASSHAASVSIKATYFNDQQQLSVLGSGSLGFFFDPNTSVETTVNGVTDSESAAAFFDPLAAEVVQADAKGSAVALLNLFSTSTLLQPGGTAYSFASRSGRMTFSGTGVLVVTVPFSIERQVIAGGIPGANGIGGVGINAFRAERGGISYSSDSYMLVTGEGPDTRTGLLALAVPFEDGETILFSATTSASITAPSVVPLPTALPLLGAALAVLGAHGRRRARGTAPQLPGAPAL